MLGVRSIVANLALAATSLVLGLAVSSALAQSRRPARSDLRHEQQQAEAARQAAGRGNHAGRWLRLYRDLSPEQQQKALENDPQFRGLPPERQQKLRDRLQHFSSLPPKQQDSILNRMETWEHLTPAQKEQAREFYSQFKGLPPERRKRLRTAIRDLRAMPPEQRQQVIESERFKSQFSPQERGLLSHATRLPLAPAGNDQAKPAPDE